MVHDIISHSSSHLDSGRRGDHYYCFHEVGCGFRMPYRIHRNRINLMQSPQYGTHLGVEEEQTLVFIIIPRISTKIMQTWRTWKVWVSHYGVWRIPNLDKCIPGGPMVASAAGNTAGPVIRRPFIHTLFWSGKTIRSTPIVVHLGEFIHHYQQAGWGAVFIGNGNDSQSSPYP